MVPKQREKGKKKEIKQCNERNTEKEEHEGKKKKKNIAKTNKDKRKTGKRAKMNMNM